MFFSLVFFLQNAIIKILPIVQAAGPGGVPPTAIPNPLIFSSVSDLLDHLLNVLLVVSGTLVVALIVYAALLYMISLGDPKRRQKANDVLKYAIIGFIIIAAARLIVSIVSSLIP